jgi:L-fucose isomerase-like protein
MNDTQAPLRKVKWGFKTNKEKLSIIISWRSTRLRARMRLVVATRYKHHLGKSSGDLKQIRKSFRSSYLGEVLGLGPGCDLL